MGWMNKGETICQHGENAKHMALKMPRPCAFRVGVPVMTPKRLLKG